MIDSKKNIKINNYENRCYIYCEAISNFVGNTKFHVPFSDLPTCASFHKDGYRGCKGYLIDVNVTTIDIVCSKYHHVDLVKIDVEGFEDKVLEGMENILANSKPDIIIECNFDGPYEEIEKILKKFDYHFFSLQENEPLSIDSFARNLTRHSNFLCISRFSNRNKVLINS